MPFVSDGQRHRRIARASFGSRIDCYAWGENVTTADGADNKSYVNNFHGTSAASAIVAGAAILVQQMVVRSGMLRSTRPKCERALAIK